MKTTRLEARAANEQHYFSGVPCKHGHVSIRRTDSGTCVVCHRAASARHYERLKAGPPEMLRWHYERQKAYKDGRQPPPRPVLS